MNRVRLAGAVAVVGLWGVVLPAVFPTVLSPGAGRGVAAEPATISFDRDIRPLLSDSCFACHGPDSANRQAGLRLDRRDSATAALDSGATAIVAGDPAASALVARITSTDPDLVMPPPGAKLGTLSPAQVDLLRRWIAAGAMYEPHWAFVAPADEALPPATEASGDHPLDRLVAARLAERGLALQPAADPVTLIRRASFDITGLPARRPKWRRSSPTVSRGPGSGSSIVCWPARATASGWRPTGWTSRATPTATASRWIAIDRCGRGATG